MFNKCTFFIIKLIYKYKNEITSNRITAMIIKRIYIYIYILFCRSSRKKSPIFYSLSLIVLHALDAILLIILLPFIIWQWISANDRLKIILKAVVEVHFLYLIFNFRNLRSSILINYKYMWYSLKFF